MTARVASDSGRHVIGGTPSTQWPTLAPLTLGEWRVVGAAPTIGLIGVAPVWSALVGGGWGVASRWPGLFASAASVLVGALWLVSTLVHRLELLS